MQTTATGQATTPRIPAATATGQATTPRIHNQPLTLSSRHQRTGQKRKHPVLRSNTPLRRRGCSRCYLSYGSRRVDSATFTGGTRHHLQRAMVNPAGAPAKPAMTREANTIPAQWLNHQVRARRSRDAPKGASTDGQHLCIGTMLGIIFYFVKKRSFLAK